MKGTAARLLRTLAARLEGDAGDGDGDLPETRARSAAAADPDADGRWLDAACADGHMELSGARVRVEGPDGWRLCGERCAVRLCLVDDRLLVSRFVGEFSSGDIEQVGALLDRARDGTRGRVRRHVCDIRLVRALSLPALRDATRVLHAERIAWLPRATHLTSAPQDIVVRLFQVAQRREQGDVVTRADLRSAVAAALVVAAPPPPGPAPSAPRYREAIARAIEDLAQIATDSAPPIAAPPGADALTRDLFRMLSLVRDDVDALARSLRGANASLEEKVRARTQDLARAKEEAETLAAEKQRLLSTMSHEVRTPLHGITSAAAALHNSPLDPEQRELNDALRAAAEHLTSLVNDLLDLARVDGDVSEVGAAPCDLPALVAEVAAALRSEARDRGVTVTVRVAPAFPRAVIANPVRMRQVFYNLLGNAVKFTARGEVHADLDLADEGTLRVRVRDDGVGIDPAFHDRLFEPFSPAAQATAARFGGTGLGLAITRRIVAVHGGDVRVESAPGAGATFTVTLPLRRPQSDAPTPARPANPEDLRGMRVLVAEDNPVIQLVAARLLRQWRVEVTVVDDGAQCLHALEDRAYDAVLMDLQMPVLDGFEAAARMRDHPRDDVRRTPVIALTADATPEARARALALGVRAFATKPCRPEELYAFLAAARGLSPR